MPRPSSHVPCAERLLRTQVESERHRSHAEDIACPSPQCQWPIWMCWRPRQSKGLGRGPVSGFWSELGAGTSHVLAIASGAIALQRMSGRRRLQEEAPSTHRSSWNGKPRAAGHREARGQHAPRRLAPPRLGKFLLFPSLGTSASSPTPRLAINPSMSVLGTMARWMVGLVKVDA